MSQTLIYPLGTTAACRHAVAVLKAAGVQMAAHPTSEVTHLLLDVPSFRPGIPEGLRSALDDLPKGITVIGGNLEHPLLTPFRKLDLLKKEAYIAQNAAITADCAVRFAAPLLTAAFGDTPTLIIGWGRIGKCLARLLRGLNCPVTVAARKESDRCILKALGYSARDTKALDLQGYHLLFNTAPEVVLTPAQLDSCPHLIKIELASHPGLTGENIHIARGLPGQMAPESSGKLIAETVLPLLKEEIP